jgi:hypothetical protein
MKITGARFHIPALMAALLCGFSTAATADSLDSNLNRLFETWRARNAPQLDSCTAWRQGLDQSQRMVFLTITHRLTTSHLGASAVSPSSIYLPLHQAYVPDYRTPLDHITTMWAIAGGHGPVPGPGPGECGGLDNNRLFMSMDQQLWLAFSLSNGTTGFTGYSGPLVDPWNNRAWRDTEDRKGAHSPFTMSDETSYGSPRGQVHFWSPRPNAQGSGYFIPVQPGFQQVWRRGVEGLVDPYMIEMDQDYDFRHQSNPMCYSILEESYLGQYLANQGNSGPEPININWEPAACRSGTTPPASGYQGCYTDDGNRALPASLGEGHTIESCTAAARGQGYRYAGLQWYGQCFAGNSLGYSRVSDAECNTPCNAAPSQMCGGAWRNSIYGTGGNPTPPPTGPDTLLPNQSLSAGGAISSGDQRFTFTYQGDGNLVLYQAGVGAIWSSGTAGSSVGRLTMQDDGNLVIYDGNGGAVWHTSTYGNPGAYLKVQSDGNVVVYSSGGGALWHTHTCCR